MDKSAIYFEENYIFRNNRSITSNNDIALTEFVANAWDAGAHNVSITIPYEEHEEIIVEDDGTGMTDEEFHSRWMTLNYDRQKRQGKRYTIIIKTDDLIDDVLPDWSGFSDSANMTSNYLSIKGEVDAFIKSVMKEHISEVRQDVIAQIKKSIKEDIACRLW